MGGAVGLPVPEDIPLILGGIAAQHGSADLLWVIIVCYFAVISGDLVIFIIGKRVGPSLFEKPWFKSKVSNRKLTHVRLRLERRSIIAIFIARHLFYLRTVTFLTCGAVNMRFSKFLIADGIAALISVPLMVGVGYFFAEHYDYLLEGIDQAKFWSIPVVLLIAATWFIFRKKRKKRGVRKNDKSPIT